MAIAYRQAGLNLLVQAATEAIQQWARDVKGMRMGILIVVHTFGADMKWHPHIHLIVTGGGLSLDGKGQAFVWECHDCHVGVVIPGTYKNIHGEIVKIDPKTLDPDTEVMRF